MISGTYESLVIRTDNTSERGHDWVVVASWQRTDARPTEWISNYLENFGENRLKRNDELFPEPEDGVTIFMYVKPVNDIQAQIGTLLHEDEFN